MNPYILTQFAERDLNDIWDHIAMDKIVRALHAARDVRELLASGSE